MIVEIYFARVSAGEARRGAERLKISRKRLKNSGLDGEVGELAFPADVNQLAGLQFLDVVRECGGRDGEGFAGHCAGQWTLRAGYFLEQLKALGIRQGLKDSGTLGAGEAWGPSRFRSIDTGREDLVLQP